MKTIIESQFNKRNIKDDSAPMIMKKIIDNEVAYNKIDGCVYLHLRDLSSFFNKGKVNVSEDRKTFEIEISKGELEQTIYNNFDFYCEAKIHQFRKFIEFIGDYNENTLIAPLSLFKDLPVSGGKIHQDYINKA